MKASPIEKALGLQPGELYGADEQCFTDETKHQWNSWHFEVYYDQMAGPLSQWKAFCVGVGSVSHMERDGAIQAMRKKIEAMRKPTSAN